MSWGVLRGRSSSAEIILTNYCSPFCEKSHLLTLDGERGVSSGGTSQKTV